MDVGIWAPRPEREDIVPGHAVDELEEPRTNRERLIGSRFFSE